MIMVLQILLASCTFGDYPNRSYRCQKKTVKCAKKNSRLPPAAIVIKCIEER